MWKLLFEGLERVGNIYRHLLRYLWPSMTTSSARQQSAISANDTILFEDVPALRKFEEYLLPALEEETQHDPHNGAAEQYLPNIVQDGHHPSPVPRTTSENGDDPVNEHLLENSHALDEAFRMLLGLPIRSNAVTVRHFWLIVKNLRDKLLESGPHEILHKEAYALVVSELKERLMACPIQQGFEYLPRPAFVPFSRRRDFVASLGLLAADIEEGFFRMQQTGDEDYVYVYIFRNMEIHTDHLSSLASRLIGA